MNRLYVAIDLKSFYASVECQQRNLNPLTTNLVVADSTRTSKTICLAVSPSLKAYGIGGRARLFEVESKIKEINRQRLIKIKTRFKDKSFNQEFLAKDPYLKVDYIVARPQMAKYIEISKQIYEVYLKWFSPEDIHVYSIDEVFIDLTSYLKLYNLKPKELVEKIVLEILKTTNITATAGIGTNLYLAKVAMDILAKKVKPNKHNTRVAYLNEKRYRKLLWDHQPITDFWRIGRGYSSRLKKYQLYTMGDIARFSIKYEDILFKEFGINAELLIDHAWGKEPCRMIDIKTYQPINQCISLGQILHRPYNYEETKIIIKEMADKLSMDLLQKGLITNKLVLTIGYDISNIKNNYQGSIKEDYYGRLVPTSDHGTINLDTKTSLASILVKASDKLYDRLVNKKLLIKRLNLVASGLYKEEIENTNLHKQISFFQDIEKEIVLENKLKKEKQLQEAILSLKVKYGNNSVLKAIDYLEEATLKQRNEMIGGHRA